MNQKKKNNIIIGALCTVLLLMVVGYAAFQSALKINGTSSISSNWDVRIIDIREGTKMGSATTALKENGEADMSYDNLSATFKANLVSPGNFIEYIITVANNGSLDARLDKISLSEPDNEYITFETSGLTEGSTLISKGGTARLTVKVMFKNVETNKMTPSTSTLKVTLDFSQANGSMADSLTTAYAYNVFEKTIGISTLTNSEYKTDYTELNSYKAGKTWFLKYDIDKEGVIQNAYACQKFSFIDEPICMQGGNPIYHTSNQKVLSDVQSIYAANPINCSLGDSFSECNVGAFGVNTISTGRVNAYNSSTDANCFIDPNGYAECVE